MKKNMKKKLRDWTNDELLKRYSYLKSKLSIKGEPSNQMKYINYHLKKRRVKI